MMITHFRIIAVLYFTGATRGPEGHGPSKFDWTRATMHYNVKCVHSEFRFVPHPTILRWRPYHHDTPTTNWRHFSAPSFRTVCHRLFVKLQAGRRVHSGFLSAADQSETDRVTGRRRSATDRCLSLVTIWSIYFCFLSFVIEEPRHVRYAKLVIRRQLVLVVCVSRVTDLLDLKEAVCFKLLLIFGPGKRVAKRYSGCSCCYQFSINP